MLDGAVGGQVLDNLAIDVKEDFDFVFGKVRVFILMIKFNRRIEERLPYLLRMIFLANFNRIIQDFFNLDIGSEVLFVKVIPSLEDTINSKSCYLH